MEKIQGFVLKGKMVFLGMEHAARRGEERARPGYAAALERRTPAERENPRPQYHEGAAVGMRLE